MSLWRQVRAKVLARRGDTADAERLAREAVAIGEEGDSLSGRGDANADLAEVLLLAAVRQDRPTLATSLACTPASEAGSHESAALHPP